MYTKDKIRMLNKKSFFVSDGGLVQNSDELLELLVISDSFGYNSFFFFFR